MGGAGYLLYVAPRGERSVIQHTAGAPFRSSPPVVRARSHDPGRPVDPRSTGASSESAGTRICEGAAGKRRGTPSLSRPERGARASAVCARCPVHSLGEARRRERIPVARVSSGLCRPNRLPARSYNRTRSAPSTNPDKKTGFNLPLVGPSRYHGWREIWPDTAGPTVTLIGPVCPISSSHVQVGRPQK